jgi:hypothetical protein
MGIFLLTLLLLQGIPTAPAQTGIVTGVLKGADGKPLAGIRIAAVPPLDPNGLGEAAAMSALAQTDDQGRFILEGLPQGRYYIAAGRVDLPTYFPGTQEMTGATIISVSPGTMVTAIDFVMKDSSTRQLTTFDLQLANIAPQIPLQVRVEGGGKLPVFANGKAVHIRLKSASLATPLTAPITATFLSVPPSINYDITVENLPDNFSVQAITYGSVNLKTTPLNGPPINAVPGYNATMAVYVNKMISLSSPTPQAAAPATTPAPAAPSQLSIVLLSSPPNRAASGVRVTGRAKDDAPRSIYISGVPGVYYLDGSFEFNGVQPGRHVLATLDGTSPLGAFLVVGDRDIEGVQLLDDASVVPFDMRTPRQPAPAGSHAPGTLLPLPTLRGSVTEEKSLEPIPEGSIKITGYSRSETYSVDSDGNFEVPHLFPGVYTLDLDIFGHSRTSLSFTVESEDTALKLTARKLY